MRLWMPPKQQFQPPPDTRSIGGKLSPKTLWQDWRRANLVVDTCYRPTTGVGDGPIPFRLAGNLPSKNGSDTGLADGCVALKELVVALIV